MAPLVDTIGPAMKTPEELLLTAADIIARDGWHQGHYCAPDGDPTSSAVCAIGALSRAGTGNAIPTSEMAWRTSAARSAAQRRLAKVAGVTPWDIPDWNDAPERSAEDVILAMKQAAHMEEDPR